MIETPLVLGTTSHAATLFKWGVGAGVVLTVVGIYVIYKMTED